MGKIDARGRSCPQPVMMTKAHVERGEDAIEVFLDNAISASNVQRYLEKNGYFVRIFDEEGSIIIRASVITEASLPDENIPATQQTGVSAQSAPPSSRSDSVSAAPASVRSAASTAVLITRKGLGGDDPLLGEVLMKGFLGTLPQMSPLPSVLALMNEGVKLAMKHTSSLEHLAILENKGVHILVCGTCTNHFGVSSDIGAGVISNMFEITEALLASDKILSL